MITIKEFRSYSLRKRSIITLEKGEYLGDTIDDFAVYTLYDFWVILNEDLTLGNIPSYAAMKSAEAVDIKPYIHDDFDDDDSEFRIIKQTNMQITLNQLAQKVKETREAQTRYFKAARKGSPDKYQVLDQSKKLEAELDELVEEILQGPRTEQKSLF